MDWFGKHQQAVDCHNQRCLFYTKLCRLHAFVHAVLSIRNITIAHLVSVIFSFILTTHGLGFFQTYVIYSIAWIYLTSEFFFSLKADMNYFKAFFISQTLN